jgi:hypothetical protein
MSTRYLIAAALMASACVAHADVLPGSSALGNASPTGDAAVQALYDKVSASVGSDSKVSLKQGADGVYVKGLSGSKALALAGDGMSVISTPDGFKIVQGVTGNANAINGGGANMTGSGTTAGTIMTGSPAPAPTSNPAPASNGNSGNSGTSGNSGNSGNNGSSSGNNAADNAGTGLGNGNGNGNGNGAGNGVGNGGIAGDVAVGVGSGNGNGNGNGNLGNQAPAAGDVPEPSSIALMLAGMLGVVGLRRRSR